MSCICIHNLTYLPFDSSNISGWTFEDKTISSSGSDESEDKDNNGNSCGNNCHCGGSTVQVIGQCGCPYSNCDRIPSSSDMRQEEDECQLCIDAAVKV